MRHHTGDATPQALSEERAGEVTIAVDIFVRSASALYVCTRADQAWGMPHQNARLGGVSALGMSARCRVARERTRSRECQRGEGKVEDAIAL